MLESLDNAQAEKADSEFNASELKTEESMELFVLKFKSIFQSEGIDEAYDTHFKFVNFSRQQNKAMNV